FDAEWRRLPCDPRPFQRHVGITGSMKRDRVRAISRILGPLQPVAIFHIAADDPTTIFPDKQIVARQQHGWLGADISKDKAASILGFIGWMLNTLFERAIGGLRRLLQTVAPNVVKPAVITAAQAVFLDPAIFERRAAMGTMKRHESKPFPAVAKQHELFT